MKNNRFLKSAAAYDEDRHWEVNNPNYKSKGNVSETEFLNRNRFLAGRNQLIEAQKEKEENK